MLAGMALAVSRAAMNVAVPVVILFDDGLHGLHGLHGLLVLDL
jgi:hypothetical protein